MTDDVLRLFSQPVHRWFDASIGTPTEIQRLAWPRIAAGDHVLVSAPTGSGKTLAAFLWAVDRLLVGAWSPGATRVLYVSPLKALGNDIRRNLEQPLAELTAPEIWGDAAVPTIRTAIRSGDTPADERRRMLRQPPEILITTPESLNILLTSRSGRELLTTVRSVILDEIHAVIGGKRGVHLITAVERLTRLAGEVQRIALSATIRPLDLVADWVGGSRLDGDARDPVLHRRRVVVLRSDAPKQYELDVALPTLGDDEARASGDATWQALAAELHRRVLRNRSTLIFANSRRTVEKVARFVNEAAGGVLAYSHHGALSRELRTLVEERMKAGSLRAVVATNSLELGIDVGAIDEVALVQAPPSVASAVQRLGRSGHTVGATSRGTLYPLHPRALLDAAVLVPAVLAGDIEPVKPVTNPLDVLAQVLLSMTVAEPWQMDELFDAVRCAAPYRTLPRRHFDLVLDLLAGRYASARLRSLRPLVTIDRLSGTVRARAGADRLIYLGGGTIPDRGYFQLRVSSTGAPLGELDEEFVWERSVGDTFTLGVQLWKVERITHNDVFVVPAAGRAAMAPFWRAEELDRSHFLSDKLACFLERAEDRLDDPEWAAELEHAHHLRPAAVAELRRLLLDQVAATGALPHRHRVLIEHTIAPGSGRLHQTVLHTFWGGRVNRPLGLALAAAWEARLGARPHVVHGDDCVVLTHDPEHFSEDPLALVPSAELDHLLRRTLAGSGFFGARFREAAGCALVLPRAGAGRRTPLWLNRQRAKELLAAVERWDDFPLVLEAWRTAVHDELELDALRSLLDEVAEGRIEVVHVHTERPSPFTRQVVWRQTNELMYADDRPEGGTGPRLRDDLLREVTLSSQLRPRIDPALAESLQAKLQRTAAGYAPAPGDELVDWIAERLVIPESEWSELVAAVARDHGVPFLEVVHSVSGRVLRVSLGGRRLGGVVAVELLPRLLVALELGIDRLAPRSLDGGQLPEDLAAILERLAIPADDPAATLESVLGEWLRCYGPIRVERIGRLLGLAPATLRAALDALVEADEIVVDPLSIGAVELEACDAQNLERLLRLSRTAARPQLAARPIEELPLLLAVQQGLGAREANPGDLQIALEPLFGWPAGAELWETELLPARLEPYLPGWLDALLVDTDLRWVGCGERRLTFVLEEDRDLLATGRAVGGLDDLFPHRFGRFPFEDLAAARGGDSGQLAAELWQAAWAGRATTDSFAPVRQAGAAGFRAEVPPSRPELQTTRGSRRARFERWRSARPFSGAWFLLPPTAIPSDPLELEQLRRDRARLLLDRHGVVFRELLEREAPAFSWRELFRTLRLMELSGEVLAGCFFEGVPGLQFASHEAVRRLAAGLPEDRVWWLNAVDPASPCGLGLELWRDLLPRRIPGNHLVLHGRRLVVVSERRGASLRVLVAPDHPRLADYLRFLEILVTRSVEPQNHLIVERINDEPAAESSYRPALAARFHVTRTGAALRLDRAY